MVGIVRRCFGIEAHPLLPGLAVERCAHAARIDIDAPCAIVAISHHHDAIRADDEARTAAAAVVGTYGGMGTGTTR